MINLPLYISIVFIATVLFAAFAFYKAAYNSKKVLFVFIAWFTLQSIVSLSGFYKITNTLPPRFLLLVMPPLLLIVLLFNTKKGKLFIDAINIKYLLLLHVARIPIEIVLYWLYQHKGVPELMTFSGRNFDIYSGITALFVYYFAFIKGSLNRKVFIAWNMICMLLLINIVFNAILSVESPFQQFAFEQPNKAIFYFPFVFLPSLLVPLVLFAHLISLRQLIHTGGENK